MTVGSTAHLVTTVATVDEAVAAVVAGTRNQ
jgi:hypothetical protein